MAVVITNTQKMTDAFSGVGTDARNRAQHAKEKIAIIDNEKRAFDDAIANLDQSLLEQIKDTNDTLYATRDAYDERVDVQNCRSDLFWRVVGISTDTEDGLVTTLELRCTKLGVTYSKVSNVLAGPFQGEVGYVTSKMMRFASGVTGLSTAIEYVDMGNSEELISDGSTWDAYLEPDNLHGIKLYREPYDRDIADLFVATGVGTIGVNSKDIILLTPNLNLGIETGMLVTTEGTNPFAGAGGNYVTGIGSTAKDLKPFSNIVNVSGTSTALSIVPVITVENAAIVNTLAPNRDGVYTTFDFSKDPNTIKDKFAIGTSESPYVPQTISIQGFKKKGKGVEIKYVNNGVPESVQEWNKFLEGFPDPDQLPTGREGSPDDIVEVEEPKVGAGKIYYRVGFDQKPVRPNGGTDASEGDTVQVISDSQNSFPQNLYQSLSACDNTAVGAAISVRDAAEAALSGDNDFPKKISLANTVRAKRTELQLSIWAYRTHIGDADDQASFIFNFNQIINDSEYKDIMNGTD